MSRGTVQSMTGYGRGSARDAVGTVTVEARSTNHRYLELEARLPNGLAALQARLTDLLRRSFRRGRVDVSVSVQEAARDRRRVMLDEALLARYHRALMDVKGRFRLQGPVTLDHLLALPQAVVVAEERVPAERLWEPIRRAAEAAVRDLVRAREREGARLAQDLQRQMRAIERHVRAITSRQPKALAEQRRQVRRRLQELLGAKGRSSVAQLEEVASVVKDADIHEELVRIASHLTHMRQTLAGRGLVGKALDFIAQELTRETNTVGAKVSDPATARRVVEIKGCIEKIREQVQNLE
jgi:uncharacterized protein (TIGR00255 family)